MRRMHRFISRGRKPSHPGLWPPLIESIMILLVESECPDHCMDAQSDQALRCLRMPRRHSFAWRDWKCTSVICVTVIDAYWRLLHSQTAQMTCHFLLRLPVLSAFPLHLFCYFIFYTCVLATSSALGRSWVFIGNFTSVVCDFQECLFFFFFFFFYFFYFYFIFFLFFFFFFFFVCFCFCFLISLLAQIQSFFCTERYS